MEVWEVWEQNEQRRSNRDSETNGKSDGQRSEKSLFMCIYVKEECGLAPLPSGLLSLIERVTKYTLSQYGLGQ